MSAAADKGVWRPGNRVRLLENGEEFFEAAFAAISSASREVLLETFILFEDKVGLRLQALLIEAAQRGVRVEVLVDGYGSPSFSPEFLAALQAAGVRLRSYDTHAAPLGVRLHVFRRMHRKLLAVDGAAAFVGGINFSADHLADFGPQAKQDYAVELAGPIVADICGFMETAIASRGTGETWRPAAEADVSPAGDAEAMLLLRDNARRPRDIELEYRRAVRAARREIVVANAYFFPGYGFLRDLRDAARRGVRVSLIFQGEPDTQLALSAARSLYRHLVDAGVRIYEYCERPFHGKVALVDDDWCTVGSSNLDPLSLSLNLEANVFIRDRTFSDELRQRLQALMRSQCTEVEAAAVPRGRFWHPVTRPLLFHVLRHFPDWLGWVPAHTPRTKLIASDPPHGNGA
ncbi:MAG TPA: cardiolipin synthase ClsB [Luteimonas sp.]|nr:cardiolipin synthase ClsB [Luteimonas sp.]